MQSFLAKIGAKKSGEVHRIPRNGGPSVPKGASRKKKKTIIRLRIRGLYYTVKLEQFPL
jgi:hypothetical protein